MGRDEIIELMKTAGLFFDEDHPDHITVEKLEKGIIEPPFMEFDILEQNLRADGMTYLRYTVVNVRKYDDIDDGVTHARFRDAMDEAMISYRMTAHEYDDVLGLWVTRYTFTV
ncbi:MAG: hypothetical protein IJ225_10495 [Solobacterium sp.]|nr:hypothetical protein [Solobacterium sp.]